ncbi:MAG: PTS sugar transporter subunit IIB [Tissierellales bacterium]|jgi:PTS system mannose-specific IIB component|nr:PTS sugar transporter subunit IIB [Tissierellales bacterium]
MSVSFVRIDDRVIHGQIVVVWSKIRPCDGIIAVDDDIAKDKVLSMVYKNAAPVGVKAVVLSVAEGLQKLPQAQGSKKNYFIIAKTPITLAKLVQGGFELGVKKINVGPMSSRDGAITVGSNACVTPEEAKAFDVLVEAGYEIEFQLVPEKKAYTWESVRDKF